MNRVSPILDQEEQRSMEGLQRRQNTRSNQLEVFEQFAGTRICRICLEQEEQGHTEASDSFECKERELIIPCECRGSVGFVHQKCIRMWIKKQLEGSKAKRAYCEICKSQIFFKKSKVRHCDCQLKNICETSPCNIACLIAELVLIGILALVQYYVDHLMNFQLLKNTLLALLGLLCVTFVLTLFLILKEIFIRTVKQIDHIYSLTESELLGLREPRSKTVNGAPDGRKRRLVFEKKETQRPLNPFGSISPGVMVGIN